MGQQSVPYERTDSAATNFTINHVFSSLQKVLRSLARPLRLCCRTESHSPGNKQAKLKNISIVWLQMRRMQLTSFLEKDKQVIEQSH